MSRIHATFLEEVAALSTTGKPPTTLRDWFAGQALMGILAGPLSQFDLSPEAIAKDSYAYADAMLAQREKQP